MGPFHVLCCVSDALYLRQRERDGAFHRGFVTVRVPPRPLATEGFFQDGVGGVGTGGVFGVIIGVEDG